MILTSPADTAIGPGVFVAITGPSGVGKDSVIGYARDRLGSSGEVFFPRRVVTRAADPRAEDHASMSGDEFAAACAQSAFALHWEAHGHCYGLPVETDLAIAAGCVVVANVSRSALAAAQMRYRHLLVVRVVATPEILAARLIARGREDVSEIRARLARHSETTIPASTGVELDNSGDIAFAGATLVTVIEHALGTIEGATPGSHATRLRDAGAGTTL